MPPKLNDIRQKLNGPVIRKLIPLLFILVLLLDGAISESPEFSRWSFYRITPDSRGYALKHKPETRTPPIYHYFIQIVGSRDPKLRTLKVGSYDLSGQRLTEKLSDPVYRVIFVQKLLLLAAFALLCYALSGFISPLVIAPVLFLFYKFGAFSYYVNALLTEALAQAFLFFVVAIMLLFVRKKQLWPLPAVGLLCATAFLTRPAAAYTTVVLVSMIIFSAFWNFKRFAIPALIGISFIAGAYAYDSVRFPENSKKIGMNVDHTSSFLKFRHAIILANPSDVLLVKDELSRRYLREAIIIRDMYGVKHEGRKFHIKIHWPLMSKFKIHRYGAKALVLYKNIGGPIIKKHRMEYLKLRWDVFIRATTSVVPIKYLPFWLLAAFVFFTNAFIRTPLTWTALAFMLVHIGNCAILAKFGDPSFRYVHATFVMIPISVLISLCALSAHFLPRTIGDFLLKREPPREDKLTV